MVKRNASSSHTPQDKMENTTVIDTEESDMYETGLPEDSRNNNFWIDNYLDQ